MELKWVFFSFYPFQLVSQFSLPSTLMCLCFKWSPCTSIYFSTCNIFLLDANTWFFLFFLLFVQLSCFSLLSQLHSRLDPSFFLLLPTWWWWMGLMGEWVVRGAVMKTGLGGWKVRASMSVCGGGGVMGGGINTWQKSKSRVCRQKDRYTVRQNEMWRRQRHKDYGGKKRGWG